MTSHSEAQSTELGSQQAFPHTLVAMDAFGNQHTKAGVGLTKREFIAATVLAGMAGTEWSEDKNYHELATSAVKQADALLAALEQNRGD